METELQRFLQVWSTATASLCYCYYVVSGIPKGFTRLISILPVITLFTLLPFSLQTFHLGAPTAFIFLWLANFKLLLFAFDLGPLSPNPNPKPISLFLATASFPINLREIKIPNPPTPNRLNKSSFILLVKLILVFSVICLFQFDYKRILHPDVVLAVYCFYMYLAVETVLALSVAPVRALLGRRFEVDPQFNAPYLSTSLQDFWGRRWNLMVPLILRPSVYGPVRRLLASTTGPRTASFF
uniref:Wax synthase domain-containing protein n=1 Tax=Kalanchoe fedtschenkoi TaxID=63787 RepID=A0A7N0U1Q9_KALFE